MDVLPFPRAIAFVECVQDNCRLKFTFIRMWKDGAFACVVVQDPPAGDGGFYTGFDRATYTLVHKVILEYLVLFAILAYLLALLPPLLCTLGLP